MVKLINASIAAVSLSACAHAQDAAPAKVAPPDVRAVTPALADYTDAVLFGDVWKRTELTSRDRSLATVSALIANGQTAQLTGHANRALDNGVTAVELTEIVTHLAFYAGWPRTMSAVPVLKSVFDQRGVVLPAGSAEEVKLPVDSATEAARHAAVDAQTDVIAPALAGYTNDVLFNDLWRRPEFSARDRSLVTVAALVAAGQSEQLPFHLNRGLDNGLTQTQASEVVTHLAFYAGWPRAMSAVPVLRAVFQQRAIQDQAASVPLPGANAARINVQHHVPTDLGPSPNFTGSMKVESRFQRDDPARAGGGVVTFAPGAHTNWHTHPLGQTLIVTDGCGWVQQEAGSIEVIRPGDVVLIPPNARHWHGGTIETSMTHVAIAERLNGVGVTWMEAVTPAQYGAGVLAGCSNG